MNMIFSLKLAGKYYLFYSNLYNICFGLGHCKNGLVLEQPLLRGGQNSQFCQKELKITLTICDKVCLRTQVFPNLSLWVVGGGVPCYWMPCKL